VPLQASLEIDPSSVIAPVNARTFGSFVEYMGRCVYTGITFNLPVGQIGFHDRDLRYVVEPGPIDVFLGTSSADLVEAGTFTVVPDPSGRPAQKMFDGTVEVSSV
jgi:hypothetical protein